MKMRKESVSALRQKRSSRSTVSRRESRAPPHLAGEMTGRGEIVVLFKEERVIS